MNIDTRDYNDANEININSEIIVITDKAGNRYEIQELDSYKGLQIRCKDGYTVIKPSSNNVLHVSTDKL